MTGVNWDFTNTDNLNISTPLWTTAGTSTFDNTKAGAKTDWNVTTDLTLNNLTFTGANPGTTDANGGVAR
jgi:hypothetical protein